MTAALAKAFELQPTTNLTVPELIQEKFQNSGPFLLVLDNFEQVLPAAKVVGRHSGILFFSQSSGHQPVMPSDLWGTRISGDPPCARIGRRAFCAARRCGLARLCDDSRDRAGNSRNLLALDGLPLAIELAAARTKVLSPNAILDRLQSRLQLLTGGALDLPERQHTLRNTIDWSHDLLNEAERRLFRRLSVFVGGCTLEAAEAVCNTSFDLGIDLFEGLSSLVDENLVQRMDRAGRSHVSQCWRRFASTPSNVSQTVGEQSATRRAHAAYFLVLAEEGNPELSPFDRADG